MRSPVALSTPKAIVNASTLSVLETSGAPIEKISVVGVPSATSVAVEPSVMMASKSTTSLMAPELISIPFIVSSVAPVI